MSNGKSESKRWMQTDVNPVAFVKTLSHSTVVALVIYVRRSIQGVCRLSFAWSPSTSALPTVQRTPEKFTFTQSVNKYFFNQHYHLSHSQKLPCRLLVKTDKMLAFSDFVCHLSIETHFNHSVMYFYSSQCKKKNCTPSTTHDSFTYISALPLYFFLKLKQEDDISTHIHPHQLPQLWSLSRFHGLTRIYPHPNENPSAE